MRMQALEPRKLVVEFWARLRVAVWQVDATHQDARNRSFYVTGLGIFRITGQCRACHDGRVPACEDGHAVPSPLTSPDRVITSEPDCRGRKFPIGTLELLQAYDVGPRILEPLQQVGKTAVDIVDVEGGNFHQVPGGQLDRTRSSAPVLPLSTQHPHGRGAQVRTTKGGATHCWDNAGVCRVARGKAVATLRVLASGARAASLGTAVRLPPDAL